MRNLVLVGDSIFDNAAYVDGPDVRAQVETKMPDDWTVSLLAVDGSYILDVPGQLDQLPSDTQRLVVSTGGNDVLVQTEVLGDAVTSVGEALLLLDEAVAQFREDYCEMLEAVLATDIQSFVCTIYRPNFPDGDLQRMTSTALGLFNDVIIEEASLRLLPILDIRAIFTDGGDYANPIEPSVQGGEKLANGIVEMISNSGSHQGYLHGRR
ncbi:MAG: SGNH/GDSL hydrolase family protein [Chloroflexi bacterium]|nr:SGNH/GDSL hydrolase family protein [Chloroflexota bacterium]